MLRNALKSKFEGQRSNSDKQHRSISRRLVSSCLSLICIESGNRVPIFMLSPWDETSKNYGVTQEIFRWDMPTVHYGILMHNNSSQQLCHSHPGVLSMCWLVLDLWKIFSEFFSAKKWYGTCSPLRFSAIQKLGYINCWQNNSHWDTKYTLKVKFAIM